MNPILTYLALLATTILLELGLAMSVSPGRRKIVARDLVILNLLTHPMATYMVQQEHLSWFTTEALVVGLEAVGYRALTRLSWGRACALSLLCNGLTAAASFVLQ